MLEKCSITNETTDKKSDIKFTSLPYIAEDHREQS